MRTQIIQSANKQKPSYSVKQIFQDHWDGYESTHNVRSIEKEEVEKMLSCKDEGRGCFLCFCGKCNRYVVVALGCNSRICSSCGKRYTDQWAEKLANGFLEGVIHRHVVCGMPDILWPFVEANRELQKVVMDASAKTIQAVFSDRARENIDVGIVNVLHPFGRDLIFKPHVHNVVTEGGFTKDGRFVSIGRFIPYDEIHKEWQKQLLKALGGFVPDEIIDICFSKYPNGFAAYVKPERINSRKKMLEYIARYVRHPAIADSRIEVYNGEAVRFFI
jgi:hypothetical protein